jgi:hemoglobin
MNFAKTSFFWVIPVLASVTVSACGAKKPKVVEPVPAETVSDAGADVAEAAAPKTLFERVGSKKVFEDIAESFVQNLKIDNTVKVFAKLTGPKQEQYKAAWVNTLCKVSGGDCASTGAEIKDAHKGMKITDKQWDSMVTDFKAAMDEQKVADVEKEDLLAVLNQVKDDVIEVKAPPKKL